MGFIDVVLCLEVVQGVVVLCLEVVHGVVLGLDVV